MTIFKRFLIFSWLCLGAGWLYAGACWGAGAGSARDTVKYPPFVHLQGTDSLVAVTDWYAPFMAIRFQSMKTGQVVKEVNMRDRNPYLSIGFDPIDIAHSDSRFLKSHVQRSKLELKGLLPTYLYDELPVNWGLDTGIVAITHAQVNLQWSDPSNYANVMYWLEIAPMDERVFLGNYAVTTVSVWDTLGQEVLRHQFDGILDDAMMSNDGQFLMTTHAEYPEDLDPSDREECRFVRYVSVIKVPEMVVVWQDSTLSFNTEYYFQNSKYAPEKVKIVKREFPSRHQKLWVFDTLDRLLFDATPSADWQPFAFKVTPSQIAYTKVYDPGKVMTVEFVNLPYKKL